MVDIGSKIPAKMVVSKPTIWIDEAAKKMELTDLDRVDLLECVYTWQYAYRGKKTQPKVARTWVRVEKIIKKLLG